MKTSNKILFITGAVIVVMLFLAVIGSRRILNNYTNSNEYSFREMKTQPYNNFQG